jgi:ABC-2 type transport system permease protein
MSSGDPPLANAPAAVSGAAGLRLFGLIYKEALQIIRDPSSIAIAFVLPVILLLLFGYGVTLDAKHVPLGLVIEAPSPKTSDFAAALSHSEYFHVVRLPDRSRATEAMLSGQINGVIVLRSDFARKLYSASGAPIQVIINGTDANTARIISGYVQGAWQTWLTRYGSEHGRTVTAPVSVAQRMWFNADVRSRNFLIPGLIAIIMTLIGTLLTALVVAREWERGTMEALLVTPVRIDEILLGKLIPYFVLGMGGMTISTVMAVWVFGVPFHGSVFALIAVSSLFMLAALGMGLLISTLARSQFVAGQVAIIIAFLPAFILSGFIFDIASMPPVVQLLTHIIPARYFVAALQSLFLAGTLWQVLISNSLALVIMAVVFLGVTRLRTRKTLE